MPAPGADPLKLIEDLAKRKKIKTLVVSMGQGQEIIARRYMATAAADGQWVLLQNTHLSLAYLSEARRPQSTWSHISLYMPWCPGPQILNEACNYFG